MRSVAAVDYTSDPNARPSTSGAAAFIDETFDPNAPNAVARGVAEATSSTVAQTSQATDASDHVSDLDSLEKGARTAGRNNYVLQLVRLCVFPFTTRAAPCGWSAHTHGYIHARLLCAACDANSVRVEVLALLYVCDPWPGLGYPLAVQLRLLREMSRLGLLDLDSDATRELLGTLLELLGKLDSMTLDEPERWVLCCAVRRWQCCCIAPRHMGEGGWLVTCLCQVVRERAVASRQQRHALKAWHSLGRDHHVVCGTHIDLCVPVHIWTASAVEP